MTEPLHILMIDDSATDAKLVANELRRLQRPLHLERVEDPVAMNAALDQQSWDLIICDWSMPKFSAPAAIAILKERGLDLPFIIVSGTIGEETAVDAMQSGANDYVLKDRLGRLTPAIERELRESKERAARRRAELALIEGAQIATLAAEVNVALSAAETLPETLRRCSDAIVRDLGVTVARIWSMDAKHNTLVLAASSGGDVSLEESPSIAREEMRVDGELVGALEVFSRREMTPLVLRGLSVIADGLGVGIQRNLVETQNEQLEAQLRHAQKMEAVGRLAGGVAHDFNNILSVILSYGELILADLTPDDPIRPDLQEITNAGRRAADLTRQLLMFSRQQVLEPRVLDLNVVLSELQKMLQRIVGEDVDLAMLTAPNLARIRADKGSIEQVIINLVVNARDAMPTGGKLTLETANVVLDGEYVRAHFGTVEGKYVMLAVSDNGQGIDKETQARVFEPFFTTKEKGKGTGLGLSTVHGIVQQSGGYIWLYSEPGLGTTFKIYLPETDTPPEISVPVTPPVELDGTETVLLVEDEDQVRAVARGILVRHGYRVLDAPNARDAISIAELEPEEIHLLLTDVVMPGLSGPELAKRLVVARPAMKVLCMSGYTDDSAVRHGVIESEIEYLQKPLTVESLTKRVREVLDRPKR